MGPIPLQRSRIFLCLLFLFFSIAPAALAAPIAFNDYASRIRESIALIQTGDDRIPAEHATILREKFPPALLISRKGQTLKVDCGPLGRWIDEAEKSAGGRARLLTHMNALLNQIGDETGSPLSEEKAKGLLEAIFSSREFRHLKKAEPPAWKAWLQEQLRRFMEWLGMHFGNFEGKTLAWTFLAVLIAIVVAGVVLIIQIIRSTGGTGWRWRQAAIGKKEETPENVPVDWNRLRSEAERKAVSGELRDAVRALFLSVLLEGHAKGWWIYRPESTNTEHLLQMGRSQRKEPFRNLAELYENAWYGLKTVGPDDFATCRKWAEQMGGA